MTKIANPHLNDPRDRQRSELLNKILERCPEHLFSTDDKELTPIMLEEVVESGKQGLEKAA